MTRIISVHSFRGGTGKSNTTANLAVMLARMQKRVAVVDGDIQSPGIHVLFRLDPARMRHTLNDYLWGQCRIEQAAHDVTDSLAGDVRGDVERPRLFLVPSSIDTAAIARILREGYDVGTLNDGLHDLGERLRLDYLFIDTHPGVNEETLLSIAISDLLLLVLRPDNQDFQGTAVTAELARRLEVKRMLLLINKVPRTMDREALCRKVEQLYRAEVAGVLPLNEEIVDVASGGIFSNQFPSHPFSRGLQEVAARICNDSTSS